MCFCTFVYNSYSVYEFKWYCSTVIYVVVHTEGNKETLSPKVRLEDSPANRAVFDVKLKLVLP